MVWQSVTRQYWPAGEADRVQALVEAAARQRPVVHVSMKFPDVDGSPAELYVAGPDAGPERRLAVVGDHGSPITLDHGWGSGLSDVPIRR